MRSALKPSTRGSYNAWLDSLLLPRFGSKALPEVTGRELALLDAELVEDEMADSTRSNIHSVFRSVLRNAVRGGFLESIPGDLPPMPKIGRKKLKPMRRDDCESILACASPQARLAFELIAFAGLRPCEVRGLRWADVDLKAKTITIGVGITLGEETTPKSHHQEVLPLCERMCVHLERAKAKRRSPWDPVALTKQGKPWGEFGLNQTFKRAQTRAGRKGWTVHRLRHFFVTELFRSGVSAAVVQRLARHSDLATTQRYADVDANDLRSAIERLDGNGVETAARDRKS
jgi:integrase